MISTMIRDRRTGKMRRKDPKKVKIGLLAARKHRHKPMKVATKLKISKAVKKTNRTGRTIFGIRAR